MDVASCWPRVVLTEEGMREGMQIESADIPVERKADLIGALSETGLSRIVVGSFVSPRWTPQMRDMDALMERLVPRPGVTYLALALNERGLARARRYVPPLTLEDDDLPRLRVHLCDVFVRRNNNRTQEQELGRWPDIVAAAAARGVRTAAIGVNAAWGSNWRGEFTLEERMRMLRQAHGLWQEAGVRVTDVFLGDPMGWEMPQTVGRQLAAIRLEFPEVSRFHLHLHNQRGLAMATFYEALGQLGPEHTLFVDTSIGGMAGCPYCGNGRAASNLPTEDVVHFLEESGVPTGVDLYRLVDVVAFAEEVIGHPLYGHVSKAGPRPHGPHLYPEDLPRIETMREAAHFRLGPEVYAGQSRPWEPPAASAHTDAT